MDVTLDVLRACITAGRTDFEGWCSHGRVHFIILPEENKMPWPSLSVSWTAENSIGNCLMSTSQFVSVELDDFVILTRANLLLALILEPKKTNTQGTIVSTAPTAPRKLEAPVKVIRWNMAAVTTGKIPPIILRQKD